MVIVSFILAESLDKMRDLSGKELGIMTAITGLYGLVNAFSDKLFVPSIYGAFGLLAATLIMLFLLNSEQGKCRENHKQPAKFLSVLSCKKQNTFLEKKNFIMAALSFVIAGVFAVLHIKAACFVFLGMFLPDHIR